LSHDEPATVYGSRVFVSVRAGGLAISRAISTPGRRTLVAASVSLNLLLLATFKYLSFLVQNYNILLTHLHLRPVDVPSVHLPVDISFYTFMGISYLADVYRDDVSFLRFGFYLSLFPHLIAGPIVRYWHIAAQLYQRQSGLDQFALGVRRFIVGLGKKVLIGNTVALAADRILQLPPAQLTAPVALLGILCYGLQIYYDFSGYSDMAIGLARMFGFRFPENFNYPYVSRSLTEFWRRGTSRFPPGCATTCSSLWVCAAGAAVCISMS
jgi:alginate O-acetyltransferase complex protein AlgI